MEKEDWDSYAQDYHDYIISPLRKDVRNPLFQDLASLPKNLVVADLGTGRGDLLSSLTKFKQVYALDFSPKMLQEASKVHKSENITFKRFDLRKLSRAEIKCDVAIAVNSILHPHFGDVHTTLRGIHQTLNPAGFFLGIFPAMEAVIHNAKLVYEREYQKNPKRALSNMRRISEHQKYDYISALYIDGKEKQKFYYQFELEHSLRKAGFKNITIQKVFYPWGSGTGDYESFPGKPEMWDWYVKARK